jgi:hypothetical protein
MQTARNSKVILLCNVPQPGAKRVRDFSRGISTAASNVAG